MSELEQMLRVQARLHKLSGANALGLTFLNAANRIAELEANEIKSDSLCMSNARRLIKAKKITSNGRLYMELFGTGMATAYDGCRALGLDPESNITSYAEMMSKQAGDL